MLYNGVFGCHGNICYVILIIFCKVHSICPINVCINFEINRYKIDEFRKHAKNRMFKSYGSDSGFNVFDNLDRDR